MDSTIAGQWILICFRRIPRTAIMGPVFLSFVLPLKIQLSRGERVGIPLISLTLPHLCACPKLGSWFISVQFSI
jgi:hypothetical protein